MSVFVENLYNKNVFRKALKGSKAYGNYPKSTSGAQTLVAADTVDHNVLIIVTVTETFANGDGAQPTFQIGQTGTANKFAATSAFTGATVGQQFVFTGRLTATDALLVTATAGSGTTETGAIQVNVGVMPVEII